MKRTLFTIRSKSESRHVLSREGADWEQEFPAMQAALDYAKTLTEASGAKVTVFDAAGEIFATFHFGIVP